jgi:O-antigen ligase
MLTNLKALVVVLGIAWAVFALVRTFCLQWMSAQAFARRRNVWFALTVVAFASPAFWIYALFALVLLVWATGKDENPLALFVLVTFTVPNVRFYLPALVFNQLFDLTQYRILSLAILLPVVSRIWKRPDEWGDRHLRLADVLLLAFLLLQVVLGMPYESLTNTMRRSFLFGLDTFIVFYAFSRIADKEKIVEVMACFWLCCVVMAPIAVFESARGWLLYTGLASLWGDPNVFAWISRGDTLRAQAGSGHSLNLGYLMAMALGMFLYLRTRAVALIFAWLVILALAAGLFVSGSRGAWLTAALAATVFVLLRPDAFKRLAGAMAIGVVVIGVMYVTPLKHSVIDKLPIIGTADQDSVDYRQQLAEVSWSLIKQNPFFGDQFVYLQMEALRQGQGIIDIVNGYLYTALFSGGVGLALQCGVLLLPLWYAFKRFTEERAVDSDFAQAGVSLVACMVATLFFIGTAGFSPTIYVLAGLLMSYATIFANAWTEERTFPASSSNQRTSLAA